VDGEQMKSVSPAYLADRFVAPVLLIHGTEDTTVRYSQSVRMDKALFKAKKQSKLVLIDGEFHSFFLASSRKKLFEELETFLGENLGNRN
jgi:dipeptidyl aminopeptidase/acylaminoacyl peptidase